MNMHISIDTAEPLSNQDRAVLSALLGEAPAPKTGAVKTPAPKAAPKPEPVVEDEPVVEPEPEVEEDLVGGDGPTLEEAIAKAKQFVAAGDAAKVKTALGKVGAKKVSDLAEDKVGDFLAALG